MTKRNLNSASVRVAALLLLAATPALAQERLGAFVYRASRDALTDVDQSYIATPELEPTLLRTAQLIWRCDGTAKIELAIAADDFLSSDALVAVRWRFDRNPPSEVSPWGASTTGTAAFAPIEDIVAFTTGALPAGEVLVRVTDFRGVGHDLRFSLSGLSRALPRLPCATVIDELRALPPQSPALDIVFDTRALAAGTGTVPQNDATRDSTEANPDVPGFTPMTVRPTLRNVEEVQRVLMREYPAVLRDAGIGGTPVLWLFIGTTGVVERTQVQETSGFDALDQAAANVALVMRFTPARNGDETVAVWVQIPIRFSVLN